jgi:serine/threonine protein kinase
MVNQANYTCLIQIAEEDTTFLMHAIHVPTKQQVVIKCPKAGCAQTFVEAQVLPHLAHDAIIKIREVIETPDGLALVLPFAAGGDLYNLIAKREGLSEGDARAILSKLLGAVAHVHASGFCHGDLKPENVLVMSGNAQDIALCDFGYAVKTGQRGQRCLAGTDNYRAPERWQWGGCSEKADMWSLGVTFFVMIACALPFEFEDGLDPEECIWRGHRQLLSHPRWWNVSSRGKDLLMQLLCVDPDARITAAAALGHPWFGASPVTGAPSRPLLSGVPRRAGLDTLLQRFCPSARHLAAPLERIP